MPFIDLHNDALTELGEGELRAYLKKAKADGVDAVLLSVWTTELEQPLKVIKEKRALLDGFSGADYPRCYLHIEDAWFLTEGNIGEFIDCRPSSVGLTWNGGNALAGGAESRGGITPWGHEAVRRLEKSGIQIDTAHLNRRSFYELAKVTRRAMLCTHTCFYGVRRHRRNLTDRQIEAVIDSGGLVGLAFVPKFLTADTTNCGLHDIEKHISYFARRFGAGNLALGTDFYGTAVLPRGVAGYADIAALGITHKNEILHKNAYEFLNRAQRHGAADNGIYRGRPRRRKARPCNGRNARAGMDNGVGGRAID